TVTIYEGSSPSGPVAASGSTSAGGGHWSYTSAHLGDGTYTAQASEVDEAGNAGASEARTFTIDTSAPKVTLNAPALVSNNTRPRFTGTASDTTTVTVSIYAKASGELRATATATGTGGGWESSEA